MIAQWSHIRNSVRAALRNREFEGFQDLDGQLLPEAEVYERLSDFLSAGDGFGLVESFYTGGRGDVQVQPVA